MGTERDAKIDKVRKLLALAAGAGEHESEAAMQAAERLMLEHEIAEAELEAVPPPPEPVGMDILAACLSGSKLSRWEWALTWAVCGGSCKPWIGFVYTPAKQKVIKIIGRPSARLFYLHLRDQVRRIAEEEYALRGRPGVRWKNSFLDACARRVQSRIQAARREMTADVRRLATGSALMKVDTAHALTRAGVEAEMKLRGLKYVSGGGSGARTDHDGSAAGSRAGDRVNTSQPTKHARLA